MAKRKSSSVNKSAEIKAYKDANPDAKPKAIAEYLKKKGIDISTAYISTILSNSRRKSGTQRSKSSSVSRPVVRRTQKRGPRATSVQSGGISVDTLLKVKKLVGDVGGIDEVKTALSTYEKLLSE